GHRLAVDPDRVVDAAHDEVARCGPPESGPDRGQLVEVLLGLERPRPALAAGRADAIDDVPGRDARRATAEVLVLADDDLVERLRGDRAVLALVLVAPIAGDPDDADRSSAPGMAVRRWADPARLRLRL